jgi:hypothetical protein
MKFVVKSSDGTLFGPFDMIDDAVVWGEHESEMLGDWVVEELRSPGESS